MKQILKRRGGEEGRDILEGVPGSCSFKTTTAVCRIHELCNQHGS